MVAGTSTASAIGAVPALFTTYAFYNSDKFVYYGEEMMKNCMAFRSLLDAGVHACAVIMSSEPLIDAIPLWKRPQDGAVITGWDYPSCEAIGLLKMDFLGLRNLDVITDTVEMVRATKDAGFDIDSVKVNGEKATYTIPDPAKRYD